MAIQGSKRPYKILPELQDMAYFNLGGIQTSFQHINSFTGYSILLCDHWLCCCGLRFLTVFGKILPVSLPHPTRYPIDYVICSGPPVATSLPRLRVILP